MTWVLCHEIISGLGYNYILISGLQSPKPNISQKWNLKLQLPFLYLVWSYLNDEGNSY